MKLTLSALVFLCMFFLCQLGQAQVSKKFSYGITAGLQISDPTPDLLINSGTIDKVMSGKTLSFIYTPTQKNVLTTLQLRVVCGNDVVNRFKDFVAK